MITVLFVNHVGQVSGAEMTLRDLVAHLCESVRCVVACPGPPDRGLAAVVSEAGAEWRPLPQWRPHRWPPWRAAADWLHGRAVAAAIAELAADVRPDVIHANSLPAAVLLARARVDAPVVWQARDLRMPAAAVRLAAARATRIAAISRVVADAVAQAQPAARAKLCVIYNGIDLARLDDVAPAAVRAEYKIPAYAPLVGTVGQIVPWKRLDIFLRAAAIIAPSSPAHFVIVGADLFGEHGRLAAALRRLQDRLGLGGRVHWLGYRTDALSVVAALDVYLHTADREPLGRSLLEAMALGRPCVAPAAAGPAEIIGDRPCAVLYAPGDPAAAAAAVLRLLSDKRLAAAAASAARQRVAEAFDARRMAREYAQLYAEVVGGGGDIL